MSPGPEKQFDVDAALDRAVDVFQQYGYDGASLSELMKEMGIGKKSLYDTYGNKRDLFLKALERYSRRNLEYLRSELEKPGSAVENLRRVLRKSIMSHAGKSSCGCLIGTSIADFDVNDPEIAGILSDRVRQIEDMFYKHLVRARDAEELGANVNPRDLARALVSTLQGVALIGRVNEGRAVPQSVVNVVESLLEN